MTILKMTKWKRKHVLKQNKLGILMINDRKKETNILMKIVSNKNIHSMIILIYPFSWLINRHVKYLHPEYFYAHFFPESHLVTRNDKLKYSDPDYFTYQHRWVIEIYHILLGARRSCGAVNYRFGVGYGNWSCSYAVWRRLRGFGDVFSCFYTRFVSTDFFYFQYTF